jgi:hypothetical protein
MHKSHLTTLILLIKLSSSILVTHRRTLTLTIPTMAATGVARSPMLVPTATFADPKEAMGGTYIMMPLGKIIEQIGQVWGKKNTLTEAAEATLEASNVRFSADLSSRIPSPFARILTPLSFVETANSIPSLLNLIQGEACRFLRQG